MSKKQHRVEVGKGSKIFLEFGKTHFHFDSQLSQSLLYISSSFRVHGFNVSIIDR